MNSLNSILLEGKLIADPESKTMPSGSFVCTFTVASDRFHVRNGIAEKEVSNFDVEAWGRLGESCADTLKAGRGIRVVGRLAQERWTDAEGKPCSKVKVVADHVEYKPETKRAEPDSEEVF